MKLKLIILMLCILSTPVLSKNKISLQRAIIEMNRIKPLQNPRYQTAEELLDRNILDSTKKVAGYVEDIIIDTNSGEISSIKASFDRLNINQSAYLNFESLDIRSFSKGYGIGYRSEIIEEIFPTLLADIETAGAGDRVSLSKVVGRKVVTNEGKMIGKVENVMFNAKATKAVGLFVKLSSGSMVDEEILIPFILASFVDRPSGPVAVIHEKVKKHMVHYLQNR